MSGPSAPTAITRRLDTPRASWIPYAAPVAAFLLLTQAEALLSGSALPWYPLGYTAKVLAVSAVAWLTRSTWRDLSPRPAPGSGLLAIAVGLLVMLLWVLLDGHYPMLPFGGTRTGFNPGMLRPPWRAAFLLIRFYGLVLLVPAIEELFWRSFLMRWMENARFWRVPLGRVTPVAAAGTSVLFASAHPEWLPALLAGLLWAWLLHRTRSVAACVASHMTANLALGVYVLATGSWRFW
jgi:CAAX prenyl protease-like protein